MKTSPYDLIQEAIAYEAEAFERDEDINGADLVEWFAEWRRRVIETLRPSAAPPPTPDLQGHRFRAHMMGALQALHGLQGRLQLHSDCHHPVHSEMDRLIHALLNGGARITVGSFVVMVFKSRQEGSPCKFH